MKNYLNNPNIKGIVAIILAIIPFTSWILGTITRFMNKNYLGGILNIIPVTFFVIWICDIVTTITKGGLTILV